MHTIQDDRLRKIFIIAAFFAGFLAALLWLLRDVAGWVFAVLRAMGR
jgi:hypothetical protein